MISHTAGAATHPGCVRTRNEDSLIRGVSIYAVADGMGGHKAGDVASQTMISALEAISGDEELDRSTVLDAIRLGDQRIHDLARISNTEMGTTLAGMAILGDVEYPLLIFNVGDSRVYRLRDGELTHLTHDHSLVQELLDSQLITSSEAESHPERHVITRALGSGQPLDIDWWQLRPRVDDRMLATSDGLTRELTSIQISEILGSALSPQDAADRLVEAALDSGGRDNVTVVVVDVVSYVNNSAEIDAMDADTVDRGATSAGDDTRPRHSVTATAADSELGTI